MDFSTMNDEALQHVFNEKYPAYLIAKARAHAAITLKRDDLTEETFDNMVAAAKELMAVSNEIKRRGLVVEDTEKTKREDPKQYNESHKIYICSPYAGDTEKNVAAARRYCRFAYEQENFPIAPHLFFPQFMTDDDTDERTDSLNFGKEIINWCNEMWVFGDVISDGMNGEIEYAKERGMEIRYFTEDCEERGGKVPVPTPEELALGAEVANAFRM